MSIIIIIIIIRMARWARKGSEMGDVEKSQGEMDRANEQG